MEWIQMLKFTLFSCRRSAPSVIGICSFLLAQKFICFSPGYSIFITLEGNHAPPTLQCPAPGVGTTAVVRRIECTDFTSIDTNQPMRHNTKCLGQVGKRGSLFAGRWCNLELRWALCGRGWEQVTWKGFSQRKTEPGEDDVAGASGPSLSTARTTMDFSGVCANKVFSLFLRIWVEFLYL